MKPARTTISSGGHWEEAVGYSRAVRVGSHVSVAGTTAATAQGIVGPGDPYAQAMQALRTIQAALEKADAIVPDPPAAPDPDPGDGHDPARAQRARSSPHGRTGARPRRRCGILHRVSTKGPAPSGPER
ncbi:MAG: hypothetical protein LC119_11625 [Burkholderiales bacterium]|nr:hypothetical protein [Burkholderiales bacterium]